MILHVIRPNKYGRAVEEEGGAGAAGEDAAGFGQDEVGGGVVPGLDAVFEEEFA